MKSTYKKPSYPVRTYSDQEIKEFLELDALESKQLKKQGLLSLSGKFKVKKPFPVETIRDRINYSR